MSDKHKHRNLLRVLLDYLSGKLSGKERNTLEREMEKDPFLADAVEGFVDLSDEQVKEDLLDLNRRIEKRAYRGKRIVFYRIAASVAVLFVVTAMFFWLINNKIDDIPGNMQVTESIEKKSDQSEKEIPTIGKAEDETEPDEEIAETETEKDSGEKEVAEETIIAQEPAEKQITQEFQEKDDAEEYIAVTSQPQDESETEEITIALVEEETKEDISTVISVQKKALTAPVAAARRDISQDKAMLKKSSGKISGVVVSAEDNEPVPGVTITEKGKSMGTVSDPDGKFLIETESDSNVTLVADFIGMEKEEVQVADEENVRIELKPSVSALDEVVITSYGVKGKEGAAETDTMSSENEMNNRASRQKAYPGPDYGSFREYIQENIKFPDKDSINDRAVVVLNVTIKKTGEIGDIEVVRTKGGDFSKEAIRLIKEGPAWIPAVEEGEEVDSDVRVRIVFQRLQDENP